MAVSVVRVCTYCGEIADSLDHVIPWASRFLAKRAGRKNHHGSKYEQRTKCVPCCRLCNSGLGDRGGQTIADRARYLAAWYRKRYRKALDIPSWDIDELEELGPNMRSAIECGIDAKAYAKRVIATCEETADLNPSIAEVWAAVDIREGSVL